MKCVLVVINGKEYTEEEFNEVIEKAISAWNWIKEIVHEVVYDMMHIAKSVINDWIENAPVGYKKIIKSGKLQYYESISKGKSNNWRKVHGLPLVRRTSYN